MILRPLVYITCLFLFNLNIAFSKDTVYIVQTAWHTGILLNTSSVPAVILPEIENYRYATYIDIGWGDEKFYQAEGIPIGLALRAVLFPTSSVIRIVGYRSPIEKLYVNGRKEAIILDSTGFSDLLNFISENFIRDSAGRIIPSKVYGTSSVFFESTKKYHLFRTCNTWVASALKESGLEIRSCCIITARQLFRKIKKTR